MPSSKDLNHVSVADMTEDGISKKKKRKKNLESVEIGYLEECMPENIKNSKEKSKKKKRGRSSTIESDIDDNTENPLKKLKNNKDKSDEVNSPGENINQNIDADVKPTKRKKKHKTKTYSKDSSINIIDLENENILSNEEYNNDDSISLDKNHSIKTNGIVHEHTFQDTPNNLTKKSKKKRKEKSLISEDYALSPIIDNKEPSKKLKEKKRKSADLSESEENLSYVCEVVPEKLKKKKKKRDKKEHCSEEDSVSIVQEVDLTSKKCETVLDESSLDQRMDLYESDNSSSCSQSKRSKVDMTCEEITINTSGNETTSKPKKKKKNSDFTNNQNKNSITENVNSPQKSLMMKKDSPLHTNLLNNPDCKANHSNTKFNSQNRGKKLKFNSNIEIDNLSEFNELIPTNNKGREYTVSIAIPASILEGTCKTRELQTYVIGQLARAACIFSVDEIIVFDDHCWKDHSGYRDQIIEDCIGMMTKILEYQECPQYLRRDFFSEDPLLSKVGILNALNAPHHLLANQWCDYREGIVQERSTNKSSFAYVGLGDWVELDRKIEPGHRVTVRFPQEANILKKKFGYAVSPDEPRIQAGLYWGYRVRVANTLSEVLKNDRFKGGYDLIIGTSDKGTDVNDTSFDPFSHALIVFGGNVKDLVSIILHLKGVDGLEAAMKLDETVNSTDPSSLFQHYLNVYPGQTSRTIRTEEAVLIALSVLAPKLKSKGR